MFSVRNRHSRETGKRESESVWVHPFCDRTRSADLDIANPNTDAPVLPSCGEQKETQCVQEAGADKGINPMTTNAAISGISCSRKKYISYGRGKTHAHESQKHLKKKKKKEKILKETFF